MRKHKFWPVFFNFASCIFLVFYFLAIGKKC